MANEGRDGDGVMDNAGDFYILFKYSILIATVRVNSSRKKKEAKTA